MNLFVTNLEFAVKTDRTVRTAFQSNDKFNKMN